MEEPVFTIRRNNLDKFQGQSTASMGWFNLDHEWLKRKFSTLQTDFYKSFLKRILKVKIFKTYQNFVIPLDSHMLNLSRCNDPVTPNKKKK